jgi:hypothetical protein
VIIVRVLASAILLQVLRALVGRALKAPWRKASSLQDRHVRLEASSATWVSLLNITGVQADRALLVGVEFASRPQALPRSAAIAREAAKMDRAGADPARQEHHASAAAAFAEFRELVSGTGGPKCCSEGPRTDPTSLVGKGKVKKSVPVAKSAQATLILFDHAPTQLRTLERVWEIPSVWRFPGNLHCWRGIVSIGKRTLA